MLYIQTIFTYTKWDNFFKVIEKTKKACERSGIELSDHFAGIRKMIDIGSNTDKDVI